MSIPHLFNHKIMMKKSTEFSLNKKLLEIEKIICFVQNIFVKYHCNIKPLKFFRV